MRTLLTWLLLISLSPIALGATISGNVYYQGDSTRPVNNVIVTLKNMENNSIATYLTGTTGYYEFQNVSNGTYELKGTKLAPGSGVNMFDAIMVHLHLLGHYPFDEIQELAADVDGDGQVTQTDYEMIKDHVIFNAPFPVGEWVFLSEIITVNNLKDSNPGGLSGSSAGDVGGIFVPGGRSNGLYPVENAGKIQVSANETFDVCLRAKESLSLAGSGLVINFPSSIVTVESVDFPMPGYEYTIEDNQIRLVWDGTSGSMLDLQAGSNLVTLHCKTTSAFAEGMTAHFTLDGNTTLINKMTEVTDAGIQVPVVEYIRPSFRLSNYPNPFTSSTTLAFYLPVNGHVAVSIFDQSGHIVKNFDLGELNAGYHTLPIETASMSTGNYNCTISSQGYTDQTIRLLKVK